MPFDNWMTPPSVIELARKCLGSIDIDPASNYVAQKYVQAKKFCVAPDLFDVNVDSDCLVNGLTQNWYGNVWCNPPYSKGNIEAFTDKFLESIRVSKFSALFEDYPNVYTQRALFLVNSATDAKWYHRLIKHSTAMLLWRGRIKFWKIFNGKAWEKWEGEKSKKEGKGKVGNSPRYLNTLFYWDLYGDVEPFESVFGNYGEILRKSKTMC